MENTNPASVGAVPVTPPAPYSPANPPNWMHDNLQFFGNFTLRRLCIPGSHDAGMSTLKAKTLFAYSCNTQTQTNDIGQQLLAGVRYFDLRPVVSSGKYATGHYSYVGVDPINSYQGATGQGFGSIISQVQRFLAVHQELVILDLSHDLNTDANTYRPFIQSEWNNLLTQLQQGLREFLWQPPAGQAPEFVDLSAYALNDFINPGNKPRGTVLILINPEMAGFTLGAFAQLGFYLSGMTLDYPTILASLQIEVPFGLQPRKVLINWLDICVPGSNNYFVGKPDSEVIWAAQCYIYLNKVLYYPPLVLRSKGILLFRNMAVSIIEDKRNIRANILQSLGFQSLMQYLYINLYIYNSYSNTNDTGKMQADQFDKMRTQKVEKNDPCFLLSWILTQSDQDAAACFAQVGLGKSILDLAGDAHGVLHTVPNACTPSSFPNILYVDNIANSNVLNYVMMINFNLQALPLVWSNITIINQYTSSGASLVYSSAPNLNGVFCAFGSTDQVPKVVIMKSADGINWPAQNAPATAEYTQKTAPALAVFNNRLFCAFQSSESFGKLMVMSSSDGVTFHKNDLYYAENQTAGGIALEVFNGKLFCAFHSNDGSNKLMITYSEDGMHNWQTHFTGQYTGAGPALKAFNNKLYCVYPSNDGDHNLTWMASADGVTWKYPAFTLQNTSEQPALAVIGNQLWCAFRSNDPSNRLLFTVFENGYWTDFKNSGQTLLRTPSLCTLPGGKALLCMFPENNQGSNKMLVIQGSLKS